MSELTETALAAKYGHDIEQAENDSYWDPTPVMPGDPEWQCRRVSVASNTGDNK